MKKVKNITKVLEGQKEVAVKVTYSDNTVETYNVPANANANAVLNEIIREGKIDLKGYDTNKRVLVEQTATVNTEDSKEVVKKAKKARQAYDDAQAAESKLNNKYADVANIKVNVEGFEENKPESKPKKGRYGLVIFGTAIVTGALIWGGSKLAKTNACAPAENSRVVPTSTSDAANSEEIKDDFVIVDGTPIKEVENSNLSVKDVKELAKVACDSKYVAKCNYTQADLENVICLVNGLDMINTDCRVTDPYKVEQFFNDMTTEAIENYFNTNKIECYDYSKLYAEGSIECEALKNIENGIAKVDSKVDSDESAQEYFAKCYRVAQGLEVDGINVLQDTNEQFEGPFYYAVADRAMLYNMKQGQSLRIKAGLIWYDLGDDYKDVKYNTEELYNENGVMEGLRLDFIQNALARCSEDAKVLSK